MISLAKKIFQRRKLNAKDIGRAAKCISAYERVAFEVEDGILRFKTLDYDYDRVGYAYPQIIAYSKAYQTALCEKLNDAISTVFEEEIIAMEEKIKEEVNEDPNSDL